MHVHFYILLLLLAIASQSSSSCRRRTAVVVESMPKKGILEPGRSVQKATLKQENLNKIHIFVLISIKKSHTRWLQPVKSSVPSAISPLCKGESEYLTVHDLDHLIKKNFQNHSVWKVPTLRFLWTVQVFGLELLLCGLRPHTLHLRSFCKLYRNSF